MQFYNRTNELKKIDELVFSGKSEFIYFLWRRRIGKTSLINHYFESKKIEYLYFFVWNKWEWNLLNAFEETLYDFLWYKIWFDSLREFLKFLFEYSVKNPWLNIVFDEFQNFSFINNELYFDFQEFWDKYKWGTEVNIFCIGSIYTMMEKVFRDKWSPLFGRATAKLDINEFSIDTIKDILVDYNLYNKENLLDIYTIFWWVPKYLEVFDNIKSTKKKKLLQDILEKHYICDNSLLLREWQDLLISEFWKTSHIYFSILEAIANSHTKRVEIANYTKINYDSLWLYLDKLEKIYKYIEKLNPIVNQKNILNRYKIKDNFLIFWFRYIYKKSNLIEIWKYSHLIEFILDDINIIKWFSFERLIKKLLIKQNIKENFVINFEKIWNYWDKWWNEIDLVCFNDKTKKVVFIECKLNKKKITKKIKENLILKSENINNFKWYKKYYRYYSVDDINDLL